MPETNPTVPTLNLDGRNYPIADLSELAKAQLQNLRIADNEIQRLKNQLGLVEAAKTTFINALRVEIAKQA